MIIKCPSCGCEYEQEKADDLPMGLSNWINHGKKWGYDKYFNEKLTKLNADTK